MGSFLGIIATYVSENYTWLLWSTVYGIFYIFSLYTSADYGLSILDYFTYIGTRIQFFSPITMMILNHIPSNVRNSISKAWTSKKDIPSVCIRSCRIIVQILSGEKNGKRFLEQFVDLKIIEELLEIMDYYLNRSRKSDESTAVVGAAAETLTFFLNKESLEKISEEKRSAITIFIKNKFLPDDVDNGTGTYMLDLLIECAFGNEALNNSTAAEKLCTLLTSIESTLDVRHRFSTPTFRRGLLLHLKKVVFVETSRDTNNSDDTLSPTPADGQDTTTEAVGAPEKATWMSIICSYVPMLLSRKKRSNHHQRMLGILRLLPFIRETLSYDSQKLALDNILDLDLSKYRDFRKYLPLLQGYISTIDGCIEHMEDANKEKIKNLEEKLRFNSLDQLVSSTEPKKLVVLCGDCSDADGCIELALIAQSGADILYLMHISQPFSQVVANNSFEDISENYTTLKAFNERKPSILDKANGTYTYGTTNSVEVFLKRAQFAMQGIFDEHRRDNQQRLFFRYRGDEEECDGEPPSSYFYNEKNPFGRIWRCELETFDADFHTAGGDLGPSASIPSIHEYSEIILDISGSTAFWKRDRSAREFLLLACKWGKLTHVVVMGGVEAKEAPHTLMMEGALFRHSMATMNQLYAPKSFKEITEQLHSGPQWVVVTNNEVNHKADYNADLTYPDEESFHSFIITRVVRSTPDQSPMLKLVLQKFYSMKAREQKKWKLFDCLTGRVIADHLSGPEKLSYKVQYEKMDLRTEPNLGITIVGKEEDFVDLRMRNGDFLLNSLSVMPSIIVPRFSTEWYSS